MRNIVSQRIFIWLLILGNFSNQLVAQKQNQTLSDTIRLKDSLFWIAYNTCDTVKFQEYFATDVEFYHDKGGITLGLDNLTANTKKNLCSANDFRLRREAVPGTVTVFPMQTSNTTYGAIISGEHVFYIKQAGKETLDGLAKFTHLWIVKDGVWKMSRILSYDHKPAPQPNTKKSISLSDKLLDQYTGNYEGPKTGMMSISKEDSLLILTIGPKKFELFPETTNQFFVKGRDLNFEFIKTKNAVSKMIVRENGQIVEEAEISQKK